ncbi:MAG TPA: globin family protein [Stellaceae bacterium]|jgi:hemoglobin-like flavoprotein|nr:globin family protein [Stellaceae bacterium]
MTPQQVALVQSSFAKVTPIADQAAASFYGRLFETAPETRALFHGDMTLQGQKLMGAITTVVTNLDNLGAVVPVAQELAKRHVGYGVRPEHYAPVGAALLWTLEQGLGGDFTVDVSTAWAAAYGALSMAMIAAAYPES